MTIKQVAIIGAIDPAYSRHAVIIEGLRAVGVDVYLHLTGKNTSTRARWSHLRGAMHDLDRVDAILLPAFNQLSAPLASWLSARQDIPLLVDYLVGLSDVHQDRNNKQNWRSRLYQVVDSWNIRHMHTMTDTQAHINYFADSLHITPRSMTALPVGVRADMLVNLPEPADDRFIVQYLGTFIPFHGVDVILQSAHILRDEPAIQFELIGDGQTYSQMRQLADALALPNVRFVQGYYRPPELLDLLGRASVFLGVFGANEKTQYVIPTKIYELMGMGRPIITAQAQALSEQFTIGEHLLTIAPNDAGALADAIRHLAQDSTQYRRIAQAGRERIYSAFTPRHIGSQLHTILERL